MRLQIFSDIHFDVTPGFEPELGNDVDAVVVAGDLCQGIGEGLEWLRRLIPNPTPIVFVAGNHEFYDKHRSAERRAGADAAAALGIHFLDDATVVIAGVRFIGSTLWTDYSLFGADFRDAAMRQAMRVLNDHALIRERHAESGKFLPSDALQQHLRSRAYLESALANPFPGPTIVVTHHAPHPASVAPQFADDMLSPAFVSDLRTVIEQGRPALWVHGHTHVSFDYTHAATRIICNPLGYGDENPAFDTSLIIEI